MQDPQNLQNAFQAGFDFATYVLIIYHSKFQKYMNHNKARVAAVTSV